MALVRQGITPYRDDVGTLAYSVYPIAEMAGHRDNQTVQLNLAYVKSILIVDDSPHVRRSLRRLLETKHDWVVWEAENGGDAIDRAKELRPDLIVIDLAMPVLNGIVATSVLKQIMPAAPIVMFTAFSDPHIKRMAMAAGLDSFVDKSESPEILLGCIEQLLVRRSG